MNIRPYSINLDGEIEIKETLELARDKSQSSLSDALDGASNDTNWPETISSIEYGLLVPICRPADDKRDESRLTDWIHRRSESQDVGVTFGALVAPKNCSCHISPPCDACVRNREPIDECESWFLLEEDGTTRGFTRYVLHSQYTELEDLAKSLSKSLAYASKLLGGKTESAASLRSFVERVAKSDSGDLAREAQGLIDGIAP